MRCEVDSPIRQFALALLALVAAALACGSPGSRAQEMVPPAPARELVPTLPGATSFKVGALEVFVLRAGGLAIPMWITSAA